MNALMKVMVMKGEAMMKTIAVPILVALYISAGFFLLMRDGLQYVIKFMDWLFDKTAEFVGWDSRFWPLPKASDNPLPGHRGPDHD